MKREEELTVSVKPLEWVEHGDQDFVWHRATPPIGFRYKIEDDGFSEKKHHLTVGQLVIGNFDALDEAKAAAQADYEQRILSAIVATPKPEATEGVAATDPHQRQPFTVTIWAEGDGENTAREAVHHALSAAHRAGHNITWSDAEATEGGAHEKGIEAAWEAWLMTAGWSITDIKGTFAAGYRAALTPSPVLGNENEGSDAV